MSVKIVVRPPFFLSFFFQWRVTWHSFINCVYLHLPACFVTGFSFMLIKIEKKTLHAALSGSCMSIQLCGNRLYT